MIGRRGFLLGTGASILAPAIVRAESLMLIRGLQYELYEVWLPMVPNPQSKIIESAELYWEKGPNGRPMEGIWTFVGEKNHHRHYSDKLVTFSKQEYQHTGLLRCINVDQIIKQAEDLQLRARHYSRSQQIQGNVNQEESDQTTGNEAYQTTP